MHIYEMTLFKKDILSYSKDKMASKHFDGQNNRNFSNSNAGVFDNLFLDAFCNHSLLRKTSSNDELHCYKIGFDKILFINIFTT